MASGIDGDVVAEQGTRREVPCADFRDVSLNGSVMSTFFRSICCHDGLGNRRKGLCFFASSPFDDPDLAVMAVLANRVIIEQPRGDEAGKMADA
jgi:hypothetical protein